MNASPARLAVTLLALASLLLLVAACGGSSSDDPGETTAAGEVQDLEALYQRIENALDDAYDELGKPAVDWDNLVRVKDRAFEELTGEDAEPTWGASWSLSVLDDHVAIYVNIEGVEKEGEWRP